MAIRWVVREGEPSELGALVALAGGDPRAIEEGRVFVGLRRAQRATERVRPGDEIRIAPAREQPNAAILALDGDLVAADKPAGMPTIPDHAGSAHSLLAAVARRAGRAPEQLHPTSRLDRDVSGAVIFALSRQAAARLRQARAEGRYERRYLALAARAPEPDKGTWDAAIGRGRNPRLRAVAGKAAAPAATRYALIARAPTVETAGAVAMLGLSPLTGRTHQIRLHASHAGAPLLGDSAYGGPVRVTLPDGRVVAPGRIALHAARVCVPREDGSLLVVSSPVPSELRALWRELGGDDGDWQWGLSEDLGS